MFSSLLGALGGQPDEEQEVVEENDKEGQQLEEAEAEPKDDSSKHNAEPSSSAAPFGVNLWGLANAVTTVVKSRTDELVKSVKQTDWKAELMAFSKEAAVEGQTLSHRAAEAVEHIPDAVEHLPGQAEQVVTARLAHVPEVTTTINNVGGTIKTFGQSLLVGTKELIDQIRDGVESEIAVATRETKRAGRMKSSTGSSGKLAAMAGSAKYNRFEAEVAAMQRDSSTYCDEPDDTDDFAAWRDSFSLTAAQADIERLLASNSFMAELHARIVPAIVEPHDFWLRYFYRLHKLQAKEETRLAIAQRAKVLHEQEELGWDDDVDTAAAGNADSTTTTTAAAAADSSSSTIAAAAAADNALPSAAEGAQQDKAASNQGASQLASSASHQASDAAVAVQATVAGAVAAVVASAAQAEDSTPAHGNDALVSPPETSEADHDSPTIGSTSDASSRGDWCVVTPKLTTTSAAVQQPAAAAAASPAATSPTSSSATKPASPHAQPQQAMSYAAAAGAAAPVVAVAAQQESAEDETTADAETHNGEAAGVAKDNAHDGVAEGLNSEDEAWGDWD